MTTFVTLLELALIIMVVLALMYFARRGRMVRESEQIAAAQTQRAAILPQAAAPSLDPDATIRCPFCSELIFATAKKCKHCGEFIGGRNEVEVGYLPPEIAEKLPSMVRAEVKKLPKDKLNQFLEEYERRAKNTGTAFVWALVGCHYGYICKWGIQILFWVTFGLCGVWWFIDLFRVRSLVNDCNKDVALAVLRDLKAVSNP